MKNIKSENAVWHNVSVTREMREQKNEHQGAVVWFTGLSGSGKSTLAHSIEERLYDLSYQTYVFDGDNVRHGLCADLDFSEEDRHENIRRIGEMANLFFDAGFIVIAAFISPMREDRERVRALIKTGRFIEVYCKCTLEVCESRDVKGLYKKARLGEISNYTGISSPYEEPINPECIVETGVESLEDSVDKVMSLLREKNIIPA